MMQNKIQLFVFLAGILSKASCDLYRFVLIEEPKTWAEAQSYCRETYTDLATVQSDEDRAKLKEAANAVNFQSVAWIGFYGDPWRWLYQNMVISYANWDYKKPDSSKTNEACAFVSKNGQWDDTYCGELKYFFCRTGKDKLQDRFKYFEIRMNWYDAQMHCRKDHVDLANVTDDTENKVLVDKLLEKQDNEAWIGLSKKLWQWQWSDNTSVLWSSVKWESEQPNNATVAEECVRANTDGLMTADTCSTQLPFYCCENTKIQRVRLALKSDGYLNESTVMEAIKKKMKQILSDQDMEIRSSITWSVRPDEKIFQQQKTQESTEEMPTCEELSPMTH